MDAKQQVLAKYPNAICGRSKHYFCIYTDPPANKLRLGLGYDADGAWEVAAKRIQQGKEPA